MFLKPKPKPPVYKIMVADSTIHDQGVFATDDIKKGEIIERCPYIVIDEDDLQDENRLNDYLFTCPDVSTDFLLVMGYGMMYNHGNDATANAEWEIDEDDNRYVTFTALRKIKKGEEILQNYGKEYWDSRD